MSKTRKSLPPFVGRGDLVRSGLDLDGADRSQARWYGFDYKPPVPDQADDVRYKPDPLLQERVAAHKALEMAENPTASPLYCKRLKTLEDDTQQPTAPPVTLATVAWGNRPKTHPQFYPLMSGNRVQQMIEDVLTTVQVRGKPDVPKVIRNIAKGQPLVQVPRRAAQIRATTLQIVVDRSTRLTPVWADQSLIVNHIRRLFPSLDLLLWVFEEASGTLRPVSRDTPAWPRPELGPVLALSDLGLLGRSGTEVWWRDFARQITFGDGVAHAVLPMRDTLVARNLIGPWQIRPWEVQTAKPSEAQSEVDRLLTLASPAIRLEPGLLRGLRMQVMPDACVADEVALWRHAILASRSVEAASFAPAGKAMYMRRLTSLARSDPLSVGAALSVIRDWRHQGKDEIWYEEVLGLPEAIRDDPRFVAPHDIDAADAFFANMHGASARGELSVGQEAWLSRVGYRNRESRDGIWQHPHAAAAMVAVLEKDPDFKPPIIIEAKSNTQDWYANVTRDPNGEIWMAPGEITGQPLGTLTMRGSAVEILDPSGEERLDLVDVPKTATQVRLGQHVAPFILQSGRSRMEISAMDPSDIAWAARLTEDATGPIAELEYGETSLRFRWIPPGQSIVGPSAHEPTERTSLTREEIVLGTGFWLMERPLTNLDMRALEGMEDEHGRSLIAPYVDRFEHWPATDFSLLDLERAIDWIKSDLWTADLRLPTALEWEYACRAGRYDQSTYNGTPQIEDALDHTLSDIAWFQPESAQVNNPGRTLQALSSPQPVLQKRPNAWGLCDMLGNVAEWCAPDAEDLDVAAIKGGSWQHTAKDIRSAFEERLPVTTRKNWIGARLAIGRAEIESRRQIPRPATRLRSSKFISRNRAPRVQISYDDPYDPQRQIELPFVIGVLADLSGPRSDQSNKPALEDRNFKEIDAGFFDSVLADNAPIVTGWVPRYVPSLPGKLFQGRESVFNLDLQIRKLEDFSPYLIVQNHPELCAQLERRNRLETLHQHFFNVPATAQPIEGFARDATRVSGVFKATQGFEVTRADPDFFNDETFLKEVMGQFNLPANNAWEALLVINLAHVLYEAEDPGLIASNDIPTAVGSLIASFDMYLNGQINLILQSDAFRQLESTWRGLHYLVTNSETDQRLKIRVLDVSKSELAGDLGRHAGEELRNSAIYKLIYEREYDTLGGEPYGVLIGDYAFSDEPKDISTLRGMSEICADALVPFIASADLDFFGISNWSELETSNLDLERKALGSAYERWTALRESEGAEFLGLTLPRVLARTPYGQEEQPVDGFQFTEDVGESNENLPLFTFQNTQGDVEHRGPLSVSLSDRREAELSKLGFMPLLHRKNTDTAAFIGAQSLFKTPIYADGDQSREAQTRSRLPFLFPALRFGQYLKVMARDQMGTMMSRSELQDKMQQWINQYVQMSPETTGEMERAKKPLASADIQLDQADDESGTYQARFFLRPFHQLEGVDTSLRLATKIPSGR